VPYETPFGWGNCKRKQSFKKNKEKKSLDKRPIFNGGKLKKFPQG